MSEYDVCVRIGDIDFTAEVLQSQIINGKHCLIVRVPDENIKNFNEAMLAEQPKVEDCPHAAPFRYCETCVVKPCPIGLGE